MTKKSNLEKMRAMSEKDLLSGIEERFQELAKFSLERTTGQLKSPARINFVRKDVARIKTILKEKQNG